MPVKCAYRCNAKEYESYFLNQIGSGGFPVFRAGTHQYGRGIGSFFGGILRAAIPLLKSGGKALLKQGARTGAQIANDVMGGKSLKTAAKNRAKEAGKRLFHQTIQSVGGAGASLPPNKRKKNGIKSSPATRPSHIVTNTRNKRKHRKKRAALADIFS